MLEQAVSTAPVVNAVKIHVNSSLFFLKALFNFPYSVTGLHILTHMVEAGLQRVRKKDM